MSFYQPIKAFFFLKKYPKLVTTGPRIVLVSGEDGPDKLGVYRPMFSVYKTLRPHFNVDLKVHLSFRKRHVPKIAAMQPDLVLLSFDSGEFQQLFEQHNVPLMGSDSKTCKLGYDKLAAKALVQKININIAPGIVIQKGAAHDNNIEQLHFPLIIKPLHGGTSKGLSKVDSSNELQNAVKFALKWDSEVMIEEYIPGQEYTCTVYGNTDPETLPLNRKIMRFEREEIEARGEQVDQHRFPVISDESFVQEIHRLSKQIYPLFNCRDMIRVDWKYDKQAQKLYFIEINILPWMGRPGGNIEDCAIATGLSYDEFVINLFKAALRRQNYLIN
jgi:D-alanine-D-alanine ligase